MRIDFDALWVILTDYSEHWASYKKQRRMEVGWDSNILYIGGPKHIEVARRYEKVNAEGDAIYNLLYAFGFTAEGIRRLFSACDYENKFCKANGYQRSLSKESKERLIDWALEANEI